MDSPRVYHIGSPRDYLLGVALLIVAAWFTWEFAHADHLRPIDRPILATVSALTFGGMGAFVILRGGVRALILRDDRVCVRSWIGLSRCLPVDRLRRVVWSYRYAGGLLTRYDQGRAWLELEFHDPRQGRTVVVVDYAGRSRHREVEAFARELASRAGLSWDADSHPVDSTDLPAREIIWERRRSAG
jgi:hypothetical protein